MGSSIIISCLGQLGRFLSGIREGGPCGSVPGLALLVFIASCSLIDGSAAHAQTSTAAAPQPKTTESQPPARADDWERLIYLPYKNLKSVFDKEGATVFMPYAQFLKMWEQTRPAGPGGKPPVSAVVTEAVYKGRVEKDLARIDLDLTIQVLGPPWAELPVRFGDAAIGKISSKDNAAILQGTGEGAYKLLLPTPGEHKVHLELMTRVRTSPDGQSIELECPPAGMTTFEMQVPVPDQTIEITPQLLVAALPGDDKSSRVKATLGATKQIGIRWRPRVSTAPVMEFLASLNNTLDVQIADGLVHTHATLAYQVLRGELGQFRIAVPLKHRVLDVSAGGLKSWKVEPAEKHQVLTVDLLGSDSKAVAIEVHTEHPVPADAFDVVGIDPEGVCHGIHSLDAVRESGLLAVGHGPELSLAVEDQSGLARVEAADVPAALRRPETRFYKFYSPRARLQVATRAVEPRLLTDQAVQLVFQDDELRLVAQLHYTVERAGVFELRFKLPPGLLIDRVESEPMREFQVPDGANLLIVSLKEKTQGEIALTVFGHQIVDGAAKESRLLPLLEPLGLARETGTILVYAPESLEVLTDEKGLHGAQPSRPDPAQVQARPGVRLASAWAYSRRPVDIPVITERKPTRLSAVVSTLVDVRQDLVSVITDLRYEVLYAGLDTFRFAVPEAAAGTVQIESGSADSPAIKQKSRADAARDGWVEWTVVLQRETTGTAAFRVKYDLPADPQAQAAQTRVVVRPVRVLDSPAKTGQAQPVRLASVSGEVAIQKDRSLAISAVAKDFEAIDVRELNHLPQEGFLAYRYFHQPEKLSEPQELELAYVRHEIQRVVETVVRRALIEAVVTDEAVITYRCRYWLRSSERQRLLLELPASVELLDSLVAGKKVDLEKSDAPAADKRQAYFVNVARKSSSDEPFTLALVFRVPYQHQPLRGVGGRLALVVPHIGGVAAGIPLVPVQQMRAAVWVPLEFSLVGSPERYTPERPTHLTLLAGATPSEQGPSELDAWFGDPAGGLFDFHPQGNAYVYRNLGGADDLEVTYWRTARYTWVISGAVLLIAIILAGTSWQNRLTIVLLAAFAAAMYTLQDADLVLHVVAAARFGLLAMPAYWLIQALNRSGKPAAKPPAPNAPVAAGTPPSAS